MHSPFYMAGRRAALHKLGEIMGGGLTAVDDRVGISAGHQEAIEDEPTPQRANRNTISTASRTTGDARETINRAFASHDAMTPQNDFNARTEYIECMD
jgi:hypothetical protein